MAFEIWDTESGNMVGSYPTRDQALAVVVDTHLRYGSDSPEYRTLVLLDLSQPEDKRLTGPELAEAAATWFAAHEEAQMKLTDATAQYRTLTEEEHTRITGIEQRLKGNPWTYAHTDLRFLLGLVYHAHGLQPPE